MKFYPVTQHLFFQLLIPVRRKIMQQNFTRRLTAAIVLLAMAILVIASPVIRAADSMLFTVRVELQSNPPRALNAVSGQVMSQSDPQVVNPDDVSTYELQAMNMSGESVDLWVVEQDLSTGQSSWSAKEITGTYSYLPYNTGMKRAWVQKDRNTACQTAERLDPNFSCDPVEPPVWVIFLPTIQR